MSKIIRIQHPGDGKWIMDRVHGTFAPETDIVIANHRIDEATGEERIVGGFVLAGYMGASFCVHMAGNDEHWCSRDLMWMLFDYSFNQMGVRKLLAPLPSTNHLALALDLRAGWQWETVIRDVYPDGHMIILSMTREHCKWLKVRPREWRSNLSHSSEEAA